MSKNSLEKYRRVIKLLEPEIILDIGCGNGSFAESLRGIFSSYIGFEPSDIPNNKEYPSTPPKNVFLFHNDSDKKLPLRDRSLDLIVFMGSYDHIPNPEGIVRDAWAKLKPEGHLMIVMSNYAFWLKSFINYLTGKEFFKNDHEHYCVHSPASLKDEILSFIPDAHLGRVEADDLYIPNLPKFFSFLYFNIWWVGVLNRMVKFIFNSIFGVRHRGSTMTLVFQKKTGLT